LITPVQQKIRDKTITPQKWAEMVKSGDWICLGGAGADGVACPDALVDRIGDGQGMVKDIELWSYGHFNPMRFHSVDPQERYHLHHEGFFFPWARKQRDESGTIDHISWEWAMGLWQSYYRFFHRQKSKRGLDWTVISCSPPEGGYFNFSYSTGGAMAWAQSAKKLVLEVRQDYPWAEGGANNLIHIDDVDYIVEVDMDKYPWPQHEEAEPGEAECKIAENILSIMQDGDCIQLGIGGLPTAVARAISQCGLKNLGVHTEMLQEGLIALIESGAVDNSQKAIDRGRSVWGFALPLNLQRYYDFVHHNKSLAVYDVNYTNNIKQLSQIDNMVAIDNFLAVDLQGRISASYYNARPISGTGGFFQFLAFCALSKGGRSIATATSTNEVKGKLVSRIVPTLPGGSNVDVPEHLVSWVATEYGMVNLWGLSSYERARALISIAHPDFRDDLERDAQRLNLKPRHFPTAMVGPERRYPDYEERRDFKLPYTEDWQYFDYDI
jgi:acyl-CoA hydrolase